MQKSYLLLFLMLYGLFVKAQSDPSVKRSKNRDSHSYERFVGKYEMQGMVIQFALQKQALVLIVPGAPIQELESVGENKFKSTIFKDAQYVFVEDSGKVTEVISKDFRGTMKGKKIAGQIELFSQAMDSLLVLNKSTEHFHFLFSATDSGSVDTIARDMEKQYKRILADFHLKKIPTVTVRIYPDLESFHKGINFPNAPDQLLATAFGKDDIRVVSPSNAGPEGWMLVYAAPHEFTHVVHLNVDYSPNNPRWLWEGIAQYQAGWFFDPAQLEIMQKKEFPHLKDLTNGLEYMLGFVIIEAIKDLWGFDAVISLIKHRGNVQKVLNLNEKVFEKRIFERIHQKYLQH